MGDEPTDEPRPGDQTEREESTDRHSHDSDHESSRDDAVDHDEEIDGDDEEIGSGEDEETAIDDNPDETDEIGAADAESPTGTESDAVSPEDEAEEVDEDEAEEVDEDEAEEAGEDEGGEVDEVQSDSEEADEEADAEGGGETAADDEDGDADKEEGDSEEEDGDEDEEDGTADESSALERKTGPQTDEEQPLAVHIEEMIKRLAIVIVIAGAVSLAAFPFAEEAITFLWHSILPADISQPHVYHPLELVLTQLKTASLLGLVIALPAFVYETYAFMRPGLYPHERRYYLAAVPTSLILALVGINFAYFIVLPAVMNYFLYYSDTVVDIAFALGQTFNLFLILMGYLAIVFQIPLFIMLAIMMGLTTRKWMEDRRLIFWGVFLGLSFLFSPDPTGMAPIIVAATMVALFEGTLLLLRWTD